MSKRYVLALICVVLLVVAVAMLYKPIKENEGLVLGAVLPLTGPGASYGKSLQQGIELGVEELNTRGGVNGAKVKVIFEDSQGDSKIATSAFIKLASIDRVPVVFTTVSGVVLTLAPIADKEKVILMNLSAISPKICENNNAYSFSLIPDGGREAVYMAQKFRELGYANRVSLLYANNAGGVDLKNRFKSEIEALGGKVVAEEGYEPGTIDFRAQLTKIKFSKALACYLVMFGTKELASALLQSKEMGLQNAWGSISGVESGDLIKIAGSAANGLIYSYPIYSNNEKMNDFQQRYKNRYNTLADVYTITAFDAIGLVEHVIKNSGSDSQSIRKALIDVSSYTGIAGNISFNERHCVVKDFMLKAVSDEKFMTYEVSIK